MQNCEENKLFTGLGEVYSLEDDDLDAVKVYLNAPKKKNYPMKWLLLWQTESEIGVSMAEQAKNQKMKLSDYRVRDYLMGTIGIGNFVYVNQSEIARELNIHRITVVESIKRLCELKVLIKGPKNGRINTYSVSPAFCFSGGLGNGIKERKATINKFKPQIYDGFEQGTLPF